MQEVTSTTSTSHHQHSYSVWMNTVVLNNIFSYLSFRKGLKFRLVNSTFNEELGISSFGQGIQRVDNILNRIGSIRKEKHRSLQFLHGGILKINAEIRNCIMMRVGSDASISEEYSSLFRNGTVSFSSWIAESATRNQGGRSELKFLTKTNDQFIFSQFYVYGNQHRQNAYNQQSLLYSLKMKVDDQEDETLIQYNVLEFSASSYLNISKIEQVLEMLNVPIHWNVRDLISFLMISSCAYPITFDNTVDLIEKIMNSDISTQTPPPIKMETVSAEQREGENNIEQIIEPLIVSNRKLDERKKQLEVLRKVLVRIYAEKSENRYNIEKKNKSTIPIDQKVLKNLLAKLIHFTKRERVLFEKSMKYGKNYVQEEKSLIEAKFTTASNKIIVVALSINNTTTSITTYTYSKTSNLMLTMDNKKVNMLNVYSTMFDKKGRVDTVELRKFGIALLTLFGQYYAVKFCNDSENTRAIFDWSQMETHLKALECERYEKNNALDYL